MTIDQPRDPSQDRDTSPKDDAAEEDGTLHQGIPDDDDLASGDFLDADQVALEDTDEDLSAELVPLEGEENDEGDAVTEDEDDNPYGDSDEALPDDAEERALRIDPSREGSRFGENVKR